MTTKRSKKPVGRPATKLVFNDEQLSELPDDELVEHPSHYTFGKIEVIDVLEDWQLPFHLANAVKYIARAGKKTESPLLDLKKARFYLNRYIGMIEKAK